MKLRNVLLASLCLIGVTTLASCNNTTSAGLTTEGVLVVGMECAYAPFNWTENFKTETNYNLAFEDPNTHKKTPLLIVGASGCLKYNKGMAQYSDRQMKINLLKLVPRLFFNKIRYGRYLDIFLTCNNF